MAMKVSESAWLITGQVSTKVLSQSNKIALGFRNFIDVIIVYFYKLLRYFSGFSAADFFAVDFYYWHDSTGGVGEESLFGIQCFLEREWCFLYSDFIFFRQRQRCFTRHPAN